MSAVLISDQNAFTTSGELRVGMYKLVRYSEDQVDGGHPTLLREEMGELIQALSKRDRGKDTDEHVFEECCDVIGTAMSECFRMGYTTNEISKQIVFKINRALGRIERGEKG